LFSDRHRLDSSVSPREREEVTEAKTGSSEVAFAEFRDLLESYRAYLMLVAESELDSDLRVKASNSDLVQQTFLEAQQCSQEFHGQTEAQWRNWLRTILKNNINDLRRRYIEAEKRDIRREVNGAHVFESAATKTDDTPSAQILLNEQQEALLLAVEKLPDRYRQVLRLRYWDQLSYEQIAERLGDSSEAVRKVHYRAVEALVNELRTQSQLST
jgi:RNA polymerase sigma-70 factor (ECF subfamily)